MQYLFVKGCGINLGRVPASNLVFQRSRRTQFLGTPFKELALACWPFHKAVIERLGIRVIVCLGAPASDFVLERLLVDDRERFTEQNDRGFFSCVYRATPDMPVIVRLSHPSIADWTATKTDPTHLVKSALDGARMD